MKAVLYREKLKEFVTRKPILKGCLEEDLQKERKLKHTKKVLAHKERRDKEKSRKPDIYNSFYLRVS